MATEYDYLLGNPAESAEAELDPVVVAELDRDIRIEHQRQRTLYDYGEMKRQGRSEAEMDSFFESNREVLTSMGVVHYPLLSTAEKSIIAEWQDICDRNERRQVKQRFWDEHHDTLNRRWQFENGGRPLD